MNMTFSFADYLRCFPGKEFPYSQQFTGQRLCDPVIFTHLLSRQQKGFALGDVFNSLKSRMPSDYFYKVYPAQTATLSYANLSFPLYRFIAPDNLAEDWMALVDFHKSFSRDHSLHQPLTAYVVHRLLGGGNPDEALKTGSGNLLDLAVDTLMGENSETAYLKDFLRRLDPDSPLLHECEPVKRELWRKLFYETAICAALFHDTGYPWQFVGRIKKSLFAGDFNIPYEKLNAEYIYETFRHRLVFYPFFEFNTPSVGVPSGWRERMMAIIEDSLTRTHGFPGALGFLYLNDMVRSSPFPKGDELSFFSHEWAALAIMMHDMVQIYWGDSTTHPTNSFLRIDFKRDPLSFIVALADFLEDYSRPHVTFLPEKSGKIVLSYSETTSEVSIDVSNSGNVEITFKFSSAEALAMCAAHKAKETREYFDYREGFIDISSVGWNQVKTQCAIASEEK